jgi:Coenzyme PQQ synthesis protein D (PqqD)
MENIQTIACPERSSATAFRIINDEAVILHLDSGIYYSLNEVGARIWELCDGSTNIENINEIICNEFEVTEEIALRDVIEVLNDLFQEGLITINENPG